MVLFRKKCIVVLVFFNNIIVKRSKDELWCYKLFREIWEGNIEYFDYSLELEI